MVVEVVFFGDLAPAGRGGEGSGRLESGCAWWLAWSMRRRREDGWFEEASALAVYVLRAGCPSRRGGRICSRLQHVEVLFFPGNGGTAAPAETEVFGASGWIRLCFFQVARGV